MNNQEHLVRVGMKWKDDEIHKLLTSIQNKKSIKDIAIEHQRTEGGIKSEIRKLAAKFFLEDKKSIEDIIKLTGLKKIEIDNAIKKRNKNEISTDMKEVILLLKDIKMKLSI